MREMASAKLEEQKTAAPAEDRENIPLSLERSAGQDEVETSVLKKILRDEFKLEETPESADLLKEVLTKLRNIIKDWVRQTAIDKKLSPEVAAKAGGELYISGSFRLGVHGSTSDIDALCVVPRFVDREQHFFGTLLEVLKKHRDIKDLRAIKEAYVPIIKLKFLNVDVDLLFARLSFESVDETLGSLRDDNLLKNCDEHTVRSLSACRNNDAIISLVPNKEAFKVTLKCMKVWAKKRDLYSNKMGYPGGIAWAILVAKICQLYPNLAPNRLLEKLFDTYCHWNWKLPILLCEMKEPKGILPLKNWNPKSCEGEQPHLMPIITPAYPCVNCTFNVSNTTREIVLKEMARAGRQVHKINQHQPGYNWISFFKGYDFFKEYIHYLRIDAVTQNEEDHLKWEGLVESKLRLLIQELEPVRGIVHVRPYTKPFELPDHEYKCSTTFLVGFKLKAPENPAAGEFEVDLREPIFRFCDQILRHNYPLDKTKNLRITQVTRDKLPNEVFESGIRPHYPMPTKKRPTAGESAIVQEPSKKFKPEENQFVPDEENFPGGY